MLCYVRSEAVVSRVIAGETLIVPIRKGVGDLASIYSLNEVASVIWSAIAKPCTAEQIIEQVEREFAAHPDNIERDVRSFLDEMGSAGLIVSSVGAAA